MPRYIIQIEVVGRDRASGPLRGVSSALGGIATIAGGIIAAQVFSKIASSIAGMATEAFNAASMFQELTIRMETLIARQLLQADASLAMKDALAQAVIPAQDLLDWVKRIAVTTPFTVASIARTVSMAQAFGFSTDEAKSLTLAIGDFTAGMGLGDEVMVSILRNFGQMITQSKVTGTELRDLARGALFPITDVLKRMQANLDMTNISLDDFRKLAARGKVDVREFFLAFEELVSDEFGGSMERLAKTVRGITQNFKDFIQSILGAEVLGPALNRVTDQVASALEGMLAPEVLEQFSALGETIGGIAEILIGALLPDVETTKAGVIGFLEDVNALAERVERAFFALDIGHPFLALQQLGLPGGQISSFLDEMAAAMDRIKEAVAPIVEFLQPALDRISEFVSAHGEEIRQFFIGFAIALAGVLAATAVPGIIAAIGAAITAIVVLITGPIVLIAAAIALLATAWQNNWFGMRDTLTEVWENNLKPALETIAQWLEVNIPVALAAIAKFWETRLKPAIEDIALWFGTNVPIAMKAISDFWEQTLRPAIESVVKWFKTNIPIAMQAISDFWNQTLKPAIESIVEWFAVNIPAAIEKVKAVFQSLSDFWSGTLEPAIESVISFFRDDLIPVFVEVADFISTTFQTAFEAIATFWEETLLPAIEAVVNFFETSLMPLFLAVADVVGAVLGLAFRVLSGIFTNVVVPAIRNLIEWFENKILPILKIVATVVGIVVTAAFGLFGDFITGTVIPAIRNLWEFFRDKILPIFRKVGKWIKEKVTNALRVLSEFIADKVIPKLKDLWRFIQNKVIPIFKKLRDKTLDPVRRSFERVRDVIKEIVGFLRELATKIRNVKLPSWIDPGSPTPFELGLIGINAALADTVKRVKSLRGEFGRLNSFGGGFALAPAPLALAPVGGKTITQTFNIEAHYRTVQPEADLLRDIRTLETLGRSRAT